MKENPFLYAIKFFFCLSAKKDSVWRNKNFRVFLILCYIWKLASSKIFHLQKALLLDTTQKQKRKKQLIVLQIWTTPKKIHSNDKFWLNWLYIAMMLFRENSRTSFPASLNCLEKETLSKNFLNFARKIYTHWRLAYNLSLEILFE